MDMVKNKSRVWTALKYYVPIKNWNLNDWDTIINRYDEVDNGIYRFRCSFMNLYFDENLRPVSYGKQHVIDGKVYYDIDNENSHGAGTYTFLGDVDWEKHNDWGL